MLKSNTQLIQNRLWSSYQRVPKLMISFIKRRCNDNCIWKLTPRVNSFFQSACLSFLSNFSRLKINANFSLTVFSVKHMQKENNEHATVDVWTVKSSLLEEKSKCSSRLSEKLRFPDYWRETTSNGMCFFVITYY